MQQQTIMRLWRDTAALKAAAVSEYCADLLEADAKFLLFAHHQVLLDAVEKQVRGGAGTSGAWLAMLWNRELGAFGGLPF